MTDSQIDEYTNEKLLNDPIYRKYSKNKNYKKMKKLESVVKNVIEESISENSNLTREIRRKSIVYNLNKKIEVLKNIILNQRSNEWRELYQWLNEIHKKNVEPCLTKDVFTEGAQEYLWGGPDDDGLMRREHFELVKKIYHTIQYGRHDSFINIGHSLIKPDKAEIRIKEIVKLFNQELDKNAIIKHKFINFIKHYDLHGFICTPDFEKFFCDWWDYAQFLIEEKGNYLNIRDLEMEVVNNLNYFPEHIEPLNLVPNLYRRNVNVSNGYLANSQATELKLTYDLPVRSQIPIEHIINNYLNELKHFFSRYAEENFDFQERVIEISKLQTQFQSMLHKTLKSIDETDLNSRVVEILYLKWSYEREDTYTPFEFMKELVKFFDKKIERTIEYNFRLDDKLSTDAARIWIKAVNRDVAGNHETYNLYDFSVGSIRQKLGRSLKRF